MTGKAAIVIVGTGWAGHTLANKLDSNKYQITVVSPEQTFSYTPLLASAACGLFDFGVAEEPIRQEGVRLQYVKAVVTDVDFQNNSLVCEPAFPNLKSQRFHVRYDILVLAPGCKTNDFGTPGVEEHAFFVKNVADVVAVRNRLSDLLEMASLPNTSESKQSQLLHFAIVGGGPTGIEMAAELSDLVNGDLRTLYPHLEAKASITVHDVAPQILAPFERKLSEYATSSLRSHNIQIKVNSHITKVTATEIETREDGQIGYGMLIWATGNKEVPLIDRLKVAKSSHGLERILTDQHLRIIADDGAAIHNAFALGDAADIEGKSLPTTAEVAKQKAEYLAKSLNSASSEMAQPFRYHRQNLVTYTGQRDGVVEGGDFHTGYAAWLSWRSANLFWTRSWRRRLMICIAWLLDWLGGREIARSSPR